MRSGPPILLLDAAGKVLYRSVHRKLPWRIDSQRAVPSILSESEVVIERGRAPLSVGEEARPKKRVIRDGQTP